MPAGIRLAGNSISYPVQNGVLGPELKAGMDRILAATRKAGKTTGVYCKDSTQPREFAQEGYDMMVAVTRLHCNPTHN